MFLLLGRGRKKYVLFQSALPRPRLQIYNILFNLGFFEYDVLADDGVEFLEFELAGLGPRIFFRDVVEAGVGAADQLYQDGIRLGHENGSGRLGVTRIEK